MKDIGGRLLNETSAQYYLVLCDTQENDKITLIEHAEMWWFEQGNLIPMRNSPESQVMYEQWIEFAFQDFPKPKED